MRYWLLPALAALSLIATTPSRAQDVGLTGAPFPALELSRQMAGDALLEALGPQLPAVANFYGTHPAELRAHARRDISLNADRNGRLFYVCEGITHEASGPEAAPAVSEAALTQAETFQLQSRPGAKRVIYLDFDGHITSGTSWKGGAAFGTPPYDIDGNTNAFSDVELSRIQGIWRRVAEDFACYDINVTTQDPGLEALKKGTTSDEFYGVRVCIGGSCYDWYGNSAGGVAYVGSFNWNSDTPCYVFTAQLGTGDEKYTAEAASHEAGHTLGLYHDGRNDDPATTANEATGYYQGHGNWAPIMGVGYYKSIVQWSKGEYALANNTEDDLARMTLFGAVYRVDDHGNTMGTAKALPPAASLSVAGNIETIDDVDLFVIQAGAGTLKVAVNVAAPSANLDVMLSLYNGNGDLVAFANPTSGSTVVATQTASLEVQVAFGTYYLKVEGVGFGNPLNTGYSEYASLGEYTLTGSVPDPNSYATPNAVASANPTQGPAPLNVSFTGNASFDTDGQIVAYSWTFGDGGSAMTANPTHSYQLPGVYTATLVVTDNHGLTDAHSVLVTVTGPPAPPSNLTATPACNASDPELAAISLAWQDNSNNETAFRVQWWSADSATWTDLLASTTATTATHAHLPLITAFSYRVRAETGDPTSFSEWSETASATTHSVPLPPAGLQASPGSSSIALSWSAVEKATGYRLERSLDLNAWTAVASLPGSSTSYTDSGLASGTTYSYRISAVDPCGYVTPPSSTVTVQTTATVPTAPAKLTARSISRTQINLSWADRSNNETGFRVERSADGKSWTPIATVGPNATSYSNLGLTANTLYYYRVQAFNPVGESLYSNTASTTTKR